MFFSILFLFPFSYFASYLDLLEIISIFFPSLKGLLPDLISNLSKLINFYFPILLGLC